MPIIINIVGVSKNSCIVPILVSTMDNSVIGEAKLILVSVNYGIGNNIAYSRANKNGGVVGVIGYVLNNVSIRKSIVLAIADCRIDFSYCS